MGAYFTQDSLKFLAQLRVNNERDWFQANKDRYETGVRQPMLKLISDLVPVMKKVSPKIVVDPRPVGGSMFRIYRDVRFSKDKSPYKTAVAAHFWHRDTKEGSAPAFYLRIEPGRSAVGGGIWHPEPSALKAIREKIAKGGKRWEKVSASGHREFACGMAGESLKRPPPGFDPNHPFIEDLKRKDFALTMDLSEKEVLSPKLLSAIEARLKAAAPFVAFIGEATGLKL